MNHSQQVVHNLANSMHIDQNTLNTRYGGNFVGNIVYIVMIR